MGLNGVGALDCLQLAIKSYASAWRDFLRNNLGLDWHMETRWRRVAFVCER